MEKDTLDNRSNLAFSRFEIPESKLLMGSISGKYPVRLNDGRTVVFVSDKSKEAKTRQKYESLKDRMDFPINPKKNSKTLPEI